MKTLKKIVATLLLAFITISKINAQDVSAIQQAFSSSYTSEYLGEYAKGVETMKKVYSDKSYEVNLRLGWLTYMAGQFTESVKYYQKASALMPASIEARLGAVYPYSALNNWDQVIVEYNEILKTDPSNSTVNYRMGNIYYVRENYNLAKKYFDKYLNQYPFNYDANIMSAWTLFKLGKSAEAKVLFNKALMINPKDKSALEGLGAIMK